MVKNINLDDLIFPTGDQPRKYKAWCEGFNITTREETITMYAHEYKANKAVVKSTMCPEHQSLYDRLKQEK